MSTYRPRRIDREDAERMLRGVPVDPTAGSGPLADLLAAVAAPARADEFAGEEAAVAAFREARLVPVNQLRREPMIKIALAKLLTVKIAVAAVAATTVGGVAVAASTGALSSPGEHEAAAGITTSASAQAADPSAHVPAAGAIAPASLPALCHTYTATAAEHPDRSGKALDEPAFSLLIAAAGGKGKVTAYCGEILKVPAAAASAAEVVGQTVGGVSATATVGGGVNGVDGQVGVAGGSVGASVSKEGANLGVSVPQGGADSGASVSPAGAGSGAAVSPGGADAGTGVSRGGADLGASVKP
ncbi:hypothetical protein [Protofrankia coriariae]|uniref:Uncharacterized protein n=1 Tax=Protofrankia coriariae TaxID=1562887 RepID=A0ABR5F3C7_9ACTN|nr:hypothetical protein [Protofrankia coriariae]KLL11213.1 hypothetical protein FrCorBMG51_12265 [Protofrankia coriariae]